MSTSFLRGLQRTLAEITGAVDEAGPTVEEECPAQRNAYESGRAYFDETTGKALDPKMVADTVKAELMFMRRLQVHHEVPMSYRDKSGLKAIGTGWMFTTKGDAANPVARARWLHKKSRE